MPTSTELVRCPMCNTQEVVLFGNRDRYKPLGEYTSLLVARGSWMVIVCPLCNGMGKVLETVSAAFLLLEPAFGTRLRNGDVRSIGAYKLKQARAFGCFQNEP